ncbi:MAG: hypothetical protein K2X93_06045 [Candidatus Obscuribacterales bacterium]|nr:hypothetical protein [Candidatus Obscuribacterales bacterium]
MYHSAEKWMLRLFVSAIIAAQVSGSTVMPANAEPSRLTTEERTKPSEILTISDTFSTPPPKKKLKKSPQNVAIYQYDNEPLGDRSPFLMVHGLRGEFYSNFRWKKVADHFKSDSTFHKNYKIYLARYPTLVRLDSTIPKFGKEVKRLYTACGEKPITLVALSMGGNLVYETMLDPEVESKIKVAMALGSPFHGSPLFSEDWMQYSLYKRLSMPWTRVDHSLALRLYFSRNKNLLADLGWDDADQAMPNVGKFKSKLLLGPKGNLTLAGCANERLQKLNSNNAQVKRKFITYGGYMHNPYLEPTAERYLESALLYPLTFVTTKFPAHLAREHPVLKMLNRDIASVHVNKEWQETAKPPFLYALNDGITPLASALFLPKETLQTIPLVSHEAVRKLRDKTDVRLARAFREIDHLTFIDGTRPASLNPKLLDELRPELGEKDIFAWMLSDLINSERLNQKLADESSTSNVMPPQGTTEAGSEAD